MDIKFDHSTDCILIAEGKILYAHKVILAIASPYFLELFKANSDFNRIFVIPGISHFELRLVLRYIYTGVVNVSSSQVDRFISILTFFGINVQHQQAPMENSQPDLQDDPMNGSYGHRRSPMEFPKKESPKLKRKRCGRSSCKARRKLIF
jgi:hypothetical protein